MKNALFWALCVGAGVGASLTLFSAPKNFPLGRYLEIKVEGQRAKKIFKEELSKRSEELDKLIKKQDALIKRRAQQIEKNRRLLKGQAKLAKEIQKLSAKNLRLKARNLLTETEKKELIKNKARLEVLKQRLIKNKAQSKKLSPSPPSTLQKKPFSHKTISPGDIERIKRFEKQRDAHPLRR